MSRSTTFLLSTALVAVSGLALVPGARAQAPAPGSCTISCGLGSLSAPDVMLLHFDENGVGTIAENGGPTTPETGVLAPDPSSGGGGGGGPVLTFFLPEPVVTGTACFSEPGIVGNSDCLRFTDNSGDISGGVTGAGSRMIYYSDFELGELNTALADTSFPANILAGNFLQSAEIGPENNNGFDYQPGGVPYPGNNEYIAISDAPEPASLALLGSGLLAMGAVLRRHRR